MLVSCSGQILIGEAEGKKAESYDAGEHTLSTPPYPGLAKFTSASHERITDCNQCGMICNQWGMVQVRSRP